jgi:hypothetical protein
VIWVAIDAARELRPIVADVEKTPVLLRFVSKNEIDFNVISTGYSTAKAALFRSKIAHKLTPNLAKSSISDRSGV